MITRSFPVCFVAVCCKSNTQKPGEPSVHSLQEASGCWRGNCGATSNSREILALPKPSRNQQGMCWDQGFVQGWAAFLTLATKAMRPQSRAWAITDRELCDYLWNKFPAALECTGRWTAQKILRNTKLPLEQTRGRPGRWSDYVCSASFTVFASQKKASGGTESPEQSSRWTQTWPDSLICCSSGKRKGKEKAQGVVSVGSCVAGY